ncbi:MAG: four helix bundle protein [Gammaproteobacteria bacterium]|nr:four helix bundle protein [Gammaproteobacteria bacterium]
MNNFLSISLGSLAELEAQLLSASRLGYANVEAVLDRIYRVRALILGLRNHVRRKS